MGDTPSFGAWLKRRRKALDLTQDELAQLAGCSVVTIRKLEAEVQPPSRQLAERLAIISRSHPRSAQRSSSSRALAWTPRRRNCHCPPPRVSPNLLN